MTSNPIELTPEESSAEHYGVPFPIVGVGTSAGGMEGFTQFLARITELPVHEIVHNRKTERDHVYVIPPDFRT